MAIRGWFNQKWRGVRFERSVWEPEVLEVHELFTEIVSMEGKCAVKLSMTELIRLVGNERNDIMPMENAYVIWLQLWPGSGAGGELQ